LSDWVHVDISMRFGKIYPYEMPIPISIFSFLDIYGM
jgi:hypothetical protein